MYQTKIDLVNEQYQAYPLIHYYHNAEVDSAFSLNVAKLDEALTIMLSKSHSPHHRELKFLKTSMDGLLKKFDEFHFISYNKKPVKEINWKHLGHSLEIEGRELAQDPDIVSRRQILSSMLEHENLSWEDVYETRDLGKEDESS